MKKILHSFIIILILVSCLIVRSQVTHKLNEDLLTLKQLDLPLNLQTLMFMEYELKTIFEKDLTMESNADYIKLPDNTSKFLIHPYPFSPTYAQSYYLPKILYVDSQENVYLEVHDRVEVFNTNGNTILKFSKPSNHQYLDYYSWDERNLYFFLKKDYEDKETKAYKINIPSLTSEEIKSNELGLLNPSLLPPLNKKEYSQAKRYILSITDEEGVFYGLAFTPTDASLFKNENARYLDPTNITVLKFDQTFTGEYMHPLSNISITQYEDVYSKYIVDNINIENLFNEKVVCIGLGNTYVDKKGNIYLDGLKSYVAKRVLSANNKCNSIEVENPTFFLAKIEKKLY